MKKLIKLSLPISVAGIILGSNDPVPSILHHTWVDPFLYSLSNGNSIVFNLSCGYLISIFLWYILVNIPESKKKEIIKENMWQRYKSFKKNTIGNLLYASGSPGVDYEFVDNLCDHNTFREYFSRENKKKWYAALNGLDENSRHIHDIHTDLELLYNDVTYVLNNISFTEKNSHSLFIVLQENIFKLINHNDCHYDHVRQISSFLYSILGAYSLIEGEMSEDIIQKMIDQI